MVTTAPESHLPFGSPALFLKAVARHDMTSGCEYDSRMKMVTAGSDEMGETTTAAFAVPDQYSNDLFSRAVVSGQMLSRCRQLKTHDLASSGIVWPCVDETSRATGSRAGGLRAYRRAETQGLASSRARLSSVRIGIDPLDILVYATEELVQQAPLLEQLFAVEVPNELVHAIEAETFAAILSSAATITVDKETGQSAATIRDENLEKMIGRLYPGGFNTAVWLVAVDALPQLLRSRYFTGSMGNMLTLFGRPILPCEHCSVLGTVGDIALVDLSQYLVGSSAPQRAVSAHVRFEAHESAFHFWWNINGSPAWRQAVTPLNGSATQSPFVVLATRS